VGNSLRPSNAKEEKERRGRVKHSSNWTFQRQCGKEGIEGKKRKGKGGEFIGVGEALRRQWN
jgi:hypothetical protein